MKWSLTSGLSDYLGPASAGRCSDRRGSSPAVATSTSRSPPSASSLDAWSARRTPCSTAKLVCLGDDGRPVFDALLYRRALPHFCAFDCLWLDGEDVRELPLVERKRLLRRIIPRRLGWVRYVRHVRGRGTDLFRLSCELDLEGIVAKWAASPYRLAGDRSPWVKVKNRDYSQARDRHELFHSFRA